MLLAYRSGPAPGVKMMENSVLLMKAPLSFAINLSSALGSPTVSSMVSHMMLAKPCSLLMSHLRSDSSSRILGQAIGMSQSYGMRSSVRICGTCLLSKSFCFMLVLSIMSLTRFNSPHRPGGGLESRALNLLQTSCIPHFP